MKRRDLILGSAALLAGCGGGVSNSRARGAVSISVRWPNSTSRLIPIRTQIILVYLKQNGIRVSAATIFRTSQQSEVTETINNIPEGLTEVEAFAYPDTGFLVPLATGRISVTVIDNQTINIPITLISNISTIDVSPIILGINTIRALTVTAKSIDNGIVLIDQSQMIITILSGNEFIEWNPKFRTIKAKSLGTVTIKIKDIESRLESVFTLNIGEIDPTADYFDSHWDCEDIAVDRSRGIIWKALDFSLCAIDPFSGEILRTIPLNFQPIRFMISRDDSTIIFEDATDIAFFDIDTESILPERIISGELNHTFSLIATLKKSSLSVLLLHKYNSQSSDYLECYDGTTQRIQRSPTNLIPFTKTTYLDGLSLNEDTFYDHSSFGLDYITIHTLNPSGIQVSRSVTTIFESIGSDTNFFYCIDFACKDKTTLNTVKYLENPFSGTYATGSLFDTKNNVFYILAETQTPLKYIYKYNLSNQELISYRSFSIPNGRNAILQLMRFQMLNDNFACLITSKPQGNHGTVRLP